MNYSKAFRVVRAAFGLSQAEIAKLLGIGSSQISLIESGKRQPSHKVIRSLTEALHIPPPLVTLLASEPKDLDAHRQQQPLDVLAVSLLKLLINASDERVSPLLDSTNRSEND
jgi:transcriptional regulator with XRE-family HTH domain